MDANALAIINTLNSAGFQGYLVGGCVRDLLCGKRPKDFDIATDATLPEVKKLFRRARIVGRRFPIVHVRHGREIIEVSTFRQSISNNVVHDDQGMILRDSTEGTLEEDAFRRDFTINALYYDPIQAEIIDFVGGLADIKRQRIRFIGKPAVRIAEDPVRMLRAIRFAAKLGFDIDAAITDLSADAADRLTAIPPARLFDEFTKLFLSGHSLAVWELLVSFGLATTLFPACNPNSSLATLAMRNTDHRIAEGASVTPGFLLAIVLWEDFQARLANSLSASDHPAVLTLRDQQQRIAVPRRFSTFIHEVWGLQVRLETRSRRSASRLLQHKRFRAGYDFLCLRAESEPELQETASWWTTLQSVDAETRGAMIAALPQTKRRRRRKKSEPT
ncbi:MAG TPA: polynucleotide adenylyltransferase PcnB [Gammaproteobacteria bacterium]|mgnify:CR=1 FL=1|nr:polynucleotide adenylyltransferase PcnB [Gammaproteobacteria bacterium]|tara:strand:- start:3056 stop:4222 length:1167 start_codon:yes stop_codon:yes gene_type:complete